MKILPLILFALTGTLFSQSIPQKFFDALINDKAEITEYVNKDELAKCNRLGITYTGVKNKFMLGYDLPDDIKAGIRSGKYKYEIVDLTLVDNYSEVTFKVPDANFSKVYYFQNGFVTNSTFYIRQWEKKESKYFTFNIEEPKYFNDYCIKRLDDFVDIIADTLGYTISEKRILEKEKLGYIFCADEKGVEKITGFNAKGLAMLGTDEVVTSYQTHFHEVAHLLINYKLKNLGLYTLPFFMEGFAVAVGGRGGMAPRVVTDLGYFLQKTGQLTYDSILTSDQFRSIDGSMTYPVSGLYNSFLLKELGGEKYLELYKKANGDLEYVKKLNMNSFNISTKIHWDSFLVDYKNNPDLFFNISDTSKPYRIGNIGYVPKFNDQTIKFFISDYQFIGFDKLEKNEKLYISRLFLSMFPKDSSYARNPTEIGIFVDSISVKAVNFYNDEIVVNYNKSLSYIDQFVPMKDKIFEFFIKKSILKRYNISEFMLSGEILETYLDIYKERMKK